MKQHNTLFGKATPYTKQFSLPKRVVTTPVNGNLGKGLTHEQYKDILDNIDSLKDKTTAQGMSFDEYVTYNEKATVRSDYNIADITELAKSLELLIYDLQRKWKQQEKWNKYMKQLILSAGDMTNISVLIDDKISELEQRIMELEKQLGSTNNNDSTVEVTNELEEQLNKIKNIERILKDIPGIVTDIASICNIAEGGFTLEYHTAKFSDIDLDAEVPEEDEPGSEVVDPGGDDSEEPSGEVVDPGGDDEPVNTEAYKSNLQKITVASPTDMSFNKLYASTTSLTDIHRTLEQMKSAIEQIQSTPVSTGPKMTVLFSAEITIYQSGPSITKQVSAFDGLKLADKISANKYNLTLDVSATDGTIFELTSVCTNVITTNNVSFVDEAHSGRSNGGLVSILSSISSGTGNNYTVYFQQFCQSDDNNDSWKNYWWESGKATQKFSVTGFGTIKDSTSGSSVPPVDITIPELSTLSPSCSSSKTNQEVDPNDYVFTLSDGKTETSVELSNTATQQSLEYISTKNGEKQSMGCSIGYGNSDSEGWLSWEAKGNENQITLHADANSTGKSRTATVYMQQDISLKQIIIKVTQKA